MCVRSARRISTSGLTCCAGVIQDETQETPSNLRRVSPAEIKQVRGSVERERDRETECLWATRLGVWARPTALYSP
jgi:hypothetical protein